jgi:ATP/maltotriose-dependent transcriptional regulator MalT/DNA-binding SARP family transcriptional activator
MIPKLSRRVFERERLKSLLHAAIGAGVTVLESPAGFGKTTLIAQFAREVDFTTRWLSLDSTSGSPEVFAHQLGVSLSGLVDIEPPATASKSSDLQAYVNAEVSRFIGGSPVPLLLVIDNMHELVDARDSSMLLSWLLDSMPEGSEVFLAGRERPVVSALSSRIATGDVLVLDGSALAFTVDEIRLASAAAPGVSPAEIAAATGGWPVGVMACLNGAVPSEKLSAGAFEQYLRTEVWAQVPAELQEPLRRFSLHPTITRACVEADFDGATWRSLTSWMSGRDFLCEHLSPVEFRLNPLLRSFISEEFRDCDPAGYTASLEVSARELIESGKIAEAIEFMRASGDEFQLAELLERYSPTMIIQGSLAALLRAFECVSEPTLRRRPLLRGMYARVLAHLGDPDDAVRRADGLLRDASAPATSRAHALLARLRSLRLLGRMEDAGMTAVRLAELSDGMAPEELWSEVRFHLAEFELSVTRDFLKAERLLREVIDECDARDSRQLGLLARSTLGQSLAMRGDAPSAVTVLTRAAQGWRNLGRSSNLGWVLNNLGMSHIQAGDFSSAATVLQEAGDEGVNCGNQRNVAYATASLADAQVALGQFEAARTQYEEAIRICATDALDESLAALSISGLSAALLGKGDLQQADFFARRALLVAMSSANSYEIAMCKLQAAAVEFASGNLAATVSEASEAAKRFEQMDVMPLLAVAHYRVSMAQFKANKRPEAEEALGKASAALPEIWMASALAPLVRENPMFAQWAATRRSAGAPLRELLELHSFAATAGDDVMESSAAPRHPEIVARSLGRVSVVVGGREVTDEEWASARAKEMFFLLLRHREGIRKEEVVEHLYPELPREKCNSAFHSNLYRIRRALYQDSVVKADGGTYQLNPDAFIDWDVANFERAVEKGRQSPSGSRERAAALQEALEFYEGPFASAFQSEWAAVVRSRLESDAQESLATLGGYFAGREDFESAALCMERVLKANRFNEEAAFQLARYRSRSGEVIQTLRFLDEYSRDYQDEFGEDLPSRFAELRSSIAAGVAV